MLQNVQMALDFLRFKKIKLVNIRAEDIVDSKYRFHGEMSAGATQKRFKLEKFFDLFVAFLHS